MARQPRVTVGDTVYHVLNRAVNRAKIFQTEAQYRHFESLLLEGVHLFDMRILSYCIMPNHWHLLLYPKKDGDISVFMHWLTTTHVRQRRTKSKSVGHGHLYQGSYKSFPVETDKYLVDLLRYVEQNPLRAHLVDTAQDWQWSSLYRRKRGNKEDRQLLATLPTTLPSNYLQSVNTLLPKPTQEAIQYALKKGAPFGSDEWTLSMIAEHSLGYTQRLPGRPLGT